MPDRFIDQDETQIYGPYAANKIRTQILHLLPSFDPALTYLAEELDTATKAVKTAVTAARTTDASLRKGVRQKIPALKQAIALLGRFSKHLDAHKPGSVDRKLFFTADGTAGGVGKSAARVLLAVTHIAGLLKQKAPPVNDRDTWRKDFAATMAHLAPVVAHADDARTGRRSLTPEVDAAREGWMQTYLAAKSTVESVLRLSGRIHQMPIVFYDLAVPSNAKVTAPPADAGAKGGEAPSGPKGGKGP